MAPRVGLTRERVIDAALELVVTHGDVEAVSLGSVAKHLGVRAQSVSAHVGGAEGLRRGVAVRALRTMADVLGDAAMGRSGADAVAAIVHAYVEFASSNPGLFSASLLPPGGDQELQAAVDAATEPLNSAFRAYGLDEDTRVHWYRVVFSAVHGFSTLQRNGRWTYRSATEQTLAHMVRIFTDQLCRDAQRVADTRIDVE